MNSIEKAEEVARWLSLEKEDSRLEYENLIERTSLQEKRLKGVVWEPVEILETGFGLGDYPYVILQRTKLTELPHRFSGGKLVQLYPAEREENPESGTVYFADRNKMKVVLHGNELPHWIHQRVGVLLQFDEASFREMEIAMNNLKAAEKDRLAIFRDLFYGNRQPSFKSEFPLEGLPLNESQVKAVQHILSAEDLALVHGPPGTGKTTTLVQAIKLLAKRGEKVLVCAPSNAAVDLLTEKLAQAGLNVVRSGNLSRIDPLLMEHTFEGKLANYPEMKEVKKTRRKADEFRRMAMKYKRNFGREERQQRKLLYQEARDLMKDAIATEDFLVKKTLSSAQVVTCTLVGAAGKILGGQHFDTVIIDEAAQALDPAAWIPIARAEKVVLCGDPCQLPPTVKSKKAAKAGLENTLLELGLERFPESPVLEIQYRMNEKIMGYSNARFYHDRLAADASVKDHQLDLEDPFNRPLEFIDTAGCGYEEVMHQESKSLANPEEFGLIKRHLGQLLAGNTSNTSVGVISPYKQQVIQMQEGGIELPDPEKVDLTINTIDAFQGQERDVIYISLVRSNERGEIGFLQDYRRMNVAMTRARKKLVIIGDSATLGNHEFYSTLLDYCEKQESYFSAWEWMG